jgi:hypothetical protein
MAHRMTQITPEHLITKQQCQEMIDDAIHRHSRNVGIISGMVGWIVFSLFVTSFLI